MGLLYDIFSRTATEEELERVRESLSGKSFRNIQGIILTQDVALGGEVASRKVVRKLGCQSVRLSEISVVWTRNGLTLFGT